MTIARHIIDPASGAAIFYGAENPASVGCAAVIGSLYGNQSTGTWYTKIGANDTDWTSLAAGSSGISQAFADGRYVQLANLNALGDARWLLKSGGTLGGALTAQMIDIQAGYGIRGPNGAFILARNAANTAYVDLLYMDASDVARIPRPLTVTGQITSTNIVLGGNANPHIGFNDGTYQAFWQMASGVMRLDHNGATRIGFPAAGGTQVYGALGVFSADGSTTLASVNSSGQVNAQNSYNLGGVALAAFSATYNMLYRRDSAIGILLGGSDPANYYDNTTHYFRNRSGANALALTVTLATFSGDVAVGGNVKIASQYESSLIGLYDPTKIRGVYAMGSGYQLGAGGDTMGNLYGIFFGYDHLATSGYKQFTGRALGHGFGLAEGGAIRFFCGALGMWHYSGLTLGGGLSVGGTLGVTGAAGFVDDVTITTAGKQFKDAYGYPKASVIVANRAPASSDLAEEGTIWARYV